MGTKRKSAKERIIEAAWELFLEQGYDETTLQDIITRSDTSKGAFYHHFRAKEDLLFRMAWLFDKKYDGWLERQDKNRDPLDLLYEYVIYTSDAVEHSEYGAFLPQLYGLQVMSEGHRYIMDEGREYFQILYQLLRDGIQSGAVREGWSAYEHARFIAGIHRGLTYDWLLHKCQYSLTDTVAVFIRSYIDSIRA